MSPGRSLHGLRSVAAGVVEALMGLMATRGVRCTAAAHLFCEHGRPSPGEFASGPSGFEEDFLRLKPHQFLFGAQMSISGALHQLGLFVISDSQFFSHCGNLCLPSLKIPSGYGRCQFRNRLLKVIEFNRLDEVPLRAGAQCLPYVTLIGCG